MQGMHKDAVLKNSKLYTVVACAKRWEKEGESENATLTTISKQQNCQKEQQQWGLFKSFQLFKKYVVHSVWFLVLIKSQ